MATTPFAPHELTDIQRAILRGLNREGARYIVIGGIAMQAHGIERATSDVDIWVEADADNARRVTKVLAPGAGVPPQLIEEKLAVANHRLAIPNDQNHEVDIFTSIGALDFDAAYDRAQIVTFQGRSFPLAAVPDLIATKEVAIAASIAQLEVGVPEKFPGQVAAQIARDRHDIELLSAKL